MFFRIAVAAALLAIPTLVNAFTVGDTFENPLVIATDAFVWNPPDGERRPDVEVRTNIDFFGQLTILVAETGFPDDSVAGQRTQYVLNEVNGLWEITYMRTDYLCRRGSNTVTWQSGLCP